MKMAITIVPIKVKIGQRANGHADHPAWENLPLAATATPEETIKSHMHCTWRYDKTCGHQEESVDSPYGMQWGMLCVTPQFANEAVAAFPGIVSVMTEAEASDFWDNKACSHIPENQVDEKTLNALNIEYQLREKLGQSLTALSAKITNALDPLDNEPGLKKNKIKKWTDAKITMGFVVQA